MQLQFETINFNNDQTSFIMIRNFLLVVAAAALISACGNTGKEGVSSKAGLAGDCTQVEFTSLVENPGEYVGKNISIEGKVVHVCMHSGKKMFIVGENPDIRLFITAGDEMPKFPTELLGSEIVVEGMLTKSAKAEMSGGQHNHSGEGMKKGEGVAEASGDSCSTEAALAAQPVLADLMMIYNKHTLVK